MSNIFKFPKKYKSQETFFPRNRIFYIGFRYVGPCFCDELQVLYLKRNGVLEGKRWWSMITYAKFEDYNTREYSIELEKCEEDDVPNMLDDFDMGEFKKAAGTSAPRHGGCDKEATLSLLTLYTDHKIYGLGTC